MKIRFYNWWIYWLYHKTWDGILKDRPHMVRGMRDHMDNWLKGKK